MILYHGSNQLVTEIDLMKSKLGKDFGRAFYLSTEEEQAIGSWNANFIKLKLPNRYLVA